MSDRHFEIPPETETVDGRGRRVGFELEFAGLPLAGAAEAVRELFGGEPGEDDAFRKTVEGTPFGDFAIEVDARMLRDGEYLDHLRRLGIPVDEEEVQEPIDRMVGWLAELVVPFEVVTPPLPLAELDRVEDLRAALAERRARGTGARLRYAFGLHINPEAPALDADSVLRHLRSFLALSGWLEERAEIDLSRTVAAYVAPFPEPYRRRVLEPGYAPSLEELGADYVEDNPTRNRPLDLLPLLAHALGRSAVRGVEEAELVSPRPAYHYRLPNCRLDEPEWSVAGEWNRWVEVERLAARPQALARLCAAALEEEPVGRWDKLRERALAALRRGSDG